MTSTQTTVVPLEEETPLLENITVETEDGEVSTIDDVTVISEDASDENEAPVEETPE